MDENRFYGDCSFVSGNRMEVANVGNKLRASWGMRGNWFQSLLRFDRRGRLSERPNRKPVKLGNHGYQRMAYATVSSLTVGI